MELSYSLLSRYTPLSLSAVGRAGAGGLGGGGGGAEELGGGDEGGGGGGGGGGCIG